MTEIRVPGLGESVSEATVATWFVKPGEMVVADAMLCELETDKVTVEVRAPSAGVLSEIVAKEGETVAVNALLAVLLSAGAMPPAQPKSEGPAAPQIAAPTVQEVKMTDVMVPALGESVAEATVSTWFKKPGDAVAQDEILCELETDKVSVEVPAPAAGVLSEILAPAPAPAAPAKDVEHAPAAKKAMAEAGLTPDQVTGTGRDGRIMKEDVAAAAAAPAAAPAPAAPAPVATAQVSIAPPPATVPRAPVPAEDAAREERVKMTRLRATIARRLKDAQNTAAMLTTYNEVDMSGVMDLRNVYKDQFEKKHGVKLGFMGFFVKACCHALKEIPEVNAEIDGGDIIYKNYVHMGVAVGTPSGLVVPVVRDADQKGFAHIEREIAELGKRGRDGKLTMQEMQGGSFTISNGGVYGSLMSSPILNPPQSGILGMHKIQDRPVVVNGQIVIRPMMYLALSYDHRIVDGKGAVTFLVRVKEALEDPRRLLMDL